jgi:hypothetical protein
MRKILGKTNAKIILLICLIPVVLIAAGIVINARRNAQSQAPFVPTGTIPQMLTEITSHMDPKSDPYLNTQRVAMMKSILQNGSQSQDLGSETHVEFTYAAELLNAGKTEEALQEDDLIEQQLSDADPDELAQAQPFLLPQEAIGYLRLGEQQNCCDNNNSYSCLLPITGPGVHTKQYGSRHAITCLTKLLHIKPGDLRARWLLNIAYMTVGEYPKSVPKQWLIPLKDFGGDYPMKKFYNAAPEMGLDFLNCAGGVVMEDFEGNGLLDLMISSIRPDGQMHYYHNNGDGTFSDRTKEAGLIGETGGLNMTDTDYNNDGRPDVIVLRGGWFGKDGHFPLSLLRNDGNGHFADVTKQAGLLTFGPSQTAVAFDYNGDGWLDLFVGKESTPGDPCPCQLFRNNGNGTFTDVTKQCGINITRLVKAVVSADYTHSGRPGLYLSCHDGPNILLRNDGPAGTDHSSMAPWKFTDVSHQAGVDKQKASFSCFFFDYDNDGWPDLYVAGYSTLKDVGDIAADYLGLPTTAERPRLYRNNHDGMFTDITKQAHLYKVTQGMGINFGDLDNDGWLDFYVGTGTPNLDALVPKRMFRNHDGKYFDEVTTTGDFGHLQKGHAIAFGDINNNGEEDVFADLGGAFEGDTAHDCLFVNPGNKNHWINLKLIGVKSNRIAIGAEICVTAVTPQGTRSVYRTVSTGGSFGCSPLRQEIGLGGATSIQKVTIHWPSSGITQVVSHLQMDRFYQVTEGDSTAQMLRLKTFKLPSQEEVDLIAKSAKTKSMTGMAM